MTLKNLFLNLALTVFVLAGGVMSVAAQDRPIRDRDRDRLQLQAGDALTLVEEYTGLSGTELRDAMQEADSLAALIEANGGDVDAFIDEAVALAEERIDTAVANERMTEENAEELKAQLAEQITERVNGERPLLRRRGFRQGPGMMQGGGFGPGPFGMMNGDVVELAEDATGLTRAEIADALRDGETIAALIEANGGEVDAFVDDVTAIMTENMRERVEDMVNGEHPMFGQGRGRGPGFGFGSGN